MVNDPLAFVEDYFGKLKNNIDLTKEQYIQMIVENHQKIINKVNEIEMKCKQKSKEKVAPLKTNLFEVKENLNKWKTSLKTFDVTLDTYWKSLIHKVTKVREEIKHTIEQTQNDLLLNKDHKFQPRIILENNNFGVLIAEERKYNGGSSFLIDTQTREFCLNSAIEETSSINLCGSQSNTALLKFDKWNCTGCYAPNKKEDAKCMCCGTLKPGTTAAPANDATQKAPLTGGVFSFGTKTNESPSKTAAPQPFSFGSATSPAKPFSFGIQPNQQQQTQANQPKVSFTTTQLNVDASKTQSQPSANLFGQNNPPSNIFGIVTYIFKSYCLIE